MNVRLVCTAKRRVLWMGMLPDSTWPISITSPVRMSRAALSTLSGFMWLPEPRWSAAPHFDGQRWLSAGGRHDWASTVDATAPSARERAAAKTRRGMACPPLCDDVAGGLRLGHRPEERLPPAPLAPATGQRVGRRVLGGRE